MHLQAPGDLHKGGRGVPVWYVINALQLNNGTVEVVDPCLACSFQY